MTPQLMSCSAFTVLGVPSRIKRGTESPELFGRVWKTFEVRRPEVEHVATQRVYVGVSFPTNEADVTDYVAGMMVAPGTPAPDGLAARTVAAGQYAVFECPADSIGVTYQHVFGAWLPTAPVQLDAARAAFEQYPENTPDQPVRLYIPIRPTPTDADPVR
jgi:predicted transcriptional regulator YdeE